VRNYFLILMAFFVGTVVQADVVINQTGGTEAGGSSATTRTITITGNAGGQSLTSIRLFGITTDTVNFSLNSGAVSSLTSSGGTFNLSTLAGSLNLSSNTLLMSDLEIGYQQNTVQVTSSTVFGNDIGITGGSVDLSNGGYLNYQLSAVAVPEPGTMLLGGIAAAAGGAGAWWKRRKQRRDAAALAAGDGA